MSALQKKIRSAKSASFSLKDNNVVLKPLNLSHVSKKYGGWFADKEVCKDNRHGSRALTPAELKNYIGGLANDDALLVFAILDKKTSAHVGNISLNSIDHRNLSAEISILIGEKSAWGKGIATSACGLLKTFALDKLKLHRVWMGMTQRNQAMQKVAEKIGMVYEGKLAGAFEKNGQYLDIVQYSALNKSRSAAPKIVFLTKYANIAGMEYLKKFAQEGIKLDAVIFHGESFSPKDRQIVLDRTAGKYTPLTLPEAFAGHVLPVSFVSSHNSTDCVNILNKIKPDVLILAGCDIIEAKVLATASRGVLNCHPGQLPYYRGCSCVEWAIYEDKPVVATCHMVSSKIDAGSIIHAEALPIAKGDSYEELRSKMVPHQAKVMAAGIKKFISMSKIPKMINPPKGSYRHPIDAEKLDAVKKTLKDKKYSHYVRD